MFTGAVFLRLVSPESVFDRSMALSFHLYTVSTQVSDVPTHIKFANALTLILLVLTMNALAIWFRMRLRGRKKW
jgi:phosphate transport system permease protein